MGGKQFRKNNGFTLVELIAVVAIISMIAVYITIEINQSTDDARVGLATSFLASNIPNAISSYRARNMSSCNNMGTGAAVDVTAALTSRGVTTQTAWDELWAAAYNSTTRVITVRYPIFGANANQYALAIAANLANVPQVATRTANTGDITVTYNCF